MTLKGQGPFVRSTTVRNLKSLREDYTDELNETSINPNLKSVYLADQTKFFNKTQKNLLSKSAVFSKPRFSTPTPAPRSRPNLRINITQKQTFGPLLNMNKELKPLTEEDDSPGRLRNLSKEFSRTLAQNSIKPFSKQIPSKVEPDDQSPVNLDTPKDNVGFFEEGIPNANHNLYLLKKASGYFDSKERAHPSNIRNPSPLLRNNTATYTVASQRKFEELASTKRAGSGRYVLKPK